MRVLVVTDKYPPNVVGGAEISLHMTLQSLSQRGFEIAIAVLDNAPAAEPYWDNHGGFDVCHLPSPPVWPLLHPDGFWADRLPMKSAENRLIWPEAALRYLLGAGDRSLSSRFERLRLYRKLSRAHLSDWMPSIDDDAAVMAHTGSALQHLVDAHRFDLIHADNSTSIYSVAAVLGRRRPWVAMVRDHRFFCTRRDQPANIDGRHCVSCSFQCVEAVSLPTAASLARVMDEVRAYRLNALGSAKRIATTSAFIKSGLPQALRTRTVAIGNPCDSVEDVDAAQAGVSRADPPEILVVGMVNQNKGQARLPAIAEALSKEVADFRISIAGRGELLREIQSQAQTAGVADRISVVGFLGRRELYRAYARASIVLMPNIWPEPFGRVPLEAGLSRRPVVAYGAGGVLETVVDGLTGILAAPGDEGALIGAAAKLIKSPMEAQKMGEAGRRRALDHFSLDQHVDRLAALWSETVVGN